SVPAFRIWSFTPFARAASCTSRMIRSAIGLFGLTSRAITEAWGTSSETSSSRLGISSVDMRLTPVRLPPGRARLDQADLDRIADVEDDRDRRSCGFRRKSRRSSARHDHIDPLADKVGGQRWRPIIVAFRPTVFDRYILSFDIAGFAQPLAERRQI